MKKILNIAIAIAAALPVCITASADTPKTVLDIKHSITDSNIVYPETYELNTQKRLESWYLKNYTASDERYKNQKDVPTSDETIKERLAAMNTVIEMPFNQIVRSYIDRYTAKGRGTVSTLLGLRTYYEPIFEQALEEQGLPMELKYLPIIESALNPNAVSRAGAAGLWQFIVAAGKGLDMEISSLVDERRDPYVSSKKAAEFLKSLYDTYGDWSLAIAAYNCGPGTVNKALRRAGGDSADHDFWSIYYYLPQETRGYVPMFIAANYVMNYYQNHNISPVLVTKPLVTDTLMINKRVHFNQISKVLDIPIEELRLLNPQFRADIIPGRADRPYTLVLPSQQIHAYIMSENKILGYESDKYAQRTTAQPGEKPGETVVAEIVSEEFIAETPSENDDEPIYTPPVTSTPKVASSASSGKTKTVSHKVEPGETLASIAETYGVTPEEVKSWNNLRRSSVRTGQMLRITTTPEIAAATGAQEITTSRSSGKSSSQTKTVNNNKSTAQTKTTQASSVPAKTAAATAQASSSKTTAQTKPSKSSSRSKGNAAVAAAVTEPVQPQNASRSSKRNKKEAAAAMATAQNTPKETPKKGKKGQKDPVPAKPDNKKQAAKPQPAKPAQPAEVTINKGESLEKIAKKTGTTVDQLKKANGLKGDMIKAGDKLKIPQGKTAAQDNKKAAASKKAAETKKTAEPKKAETKKNTKKKK